MSAGNPKPLTLYLDGSDINTASAAEGGVQKSLADFQVKERDLIVENLPDEVIVAREKVAGADPQTIRLADGSVDG